MTTLLLAFHSAQGKMLFVYDPLALHHILVKDQHTFEEPMSAIQ